MNSGAHVRSHPPNERPVSERLLPALFEGPRRRSRCGHLPRRCPGLRSDPIVRDTPTSSRRQRDQWGARPQDGCTDRSRFAVVDRGPLDPTLWAEPWGNPRTGSISLPPSGRRGKRATFPLIDSLACSRLRAPPADRVRRAAAPSPRPAWDCFHFYLPQSQSAPTNSPEGPRRTVGLTGEDPQGGIRTAGPEHRRLPSFGTNFSAPKEHTR